jgi:DNA polymerase III sliding clamp (beta) subunit (PCNA family)
MTARKKATVTEFELLASDVRDWLAPALHFAGRDDQLPVLCAVHVRLEGNTLTATATDRFVCGMFTHTLEPDDPLEPFELLLPRSAVSGLLSMFYPRRKRHSDGRVIKFRVTGNRLELEGTTVHGYPASIVLEGMDGQFPKVAELVEKACQEQERPQASAAYRADFLALMRHVVRPGFSPEPVQLFAAAAVGKPMGVVVGDYFRGVIMPRRLLS